MKAIAVGNRITAVGVFMAAMFLGFGVPVCEAQAFSDDTVVYWTPGSNRGHIESCRRLNADPAQREAMKTTYGVMTAGGGLLCSRCPGSETPGKGNPHLLPGGGEKAEGGKEEKSQVDIGSEPAVEYDPNTKVYPEALWMRVHAEDCPNNLLKDMKKAMTLEEADKAGYRIGECTFSIRQRAYCCLQGYKRKYSEKTFTDDTVLAGNDDKLRKRYKHLPGCHRYWPAPSDLRRTRKEWIADGFDVCPHCIHRGPSEATITDEEWAKLDTEEPFVAPAGREPRPYSLDKLPPKEEVDILIRQTLSTRSGIQELQFTDPVASAEHFTTMRFFFPVGNWLTFYQAYRATGDQRLLDKLLESARHYHKLSVDYPSVARHKASDPEGLAYMYSMAACARITLQLARKHPGQVSQKEIGEAEAFLKTMVSVLKPICEGNEALDPDMGIPRKLADDFRNRASNRAMNGIGTLSMMTVALEDLQALKQTTEYQPTIDRYRKVVREYVKHFLGNGDLASEIEGQPMFVYPYGQEPNPRIVDGRKIFNRAEDSGHYSHMLQGAMLVYESMPETGIDDDWMTAVANTVQYCGTHKIKKGNKEEWSGHFQSVTQMRVAPQGGESVKSHAFRKGPGSNRFYMLEAFRDGVIDALNTTASENQKDEASKSFEGRLKTLHAHYVKALRKDPSLIHLGEKK